MQNERSSGSSEIRGSLKIKYAEQEDPERYHVAVVETNGKTTMAIVTEHPNEAIDLLRMLSAPLLETGAKIVGAKDTAWLVQDVENITVTIRVEGKVKQLA